jgi:hypothetical protein
LRSDNKNPRRTRRTDVAGEICSPRNFGSRCRQRTRSGSVAFFRSNRARSTRINSNCQCLLRKGGLWMPLTSILSPLAGRGGGALGSDLRTFTLSARRDQLGKRFAAAS